jgi:hypothetical protein
MRKPATEWEISGQLAHIPLIDDITFVAVQAVKAQRPTKDGASRQYALAGLVVCGICDRRMDSHWLHSRPGYRCRHGYNSASGRPADAPRVAYVREDLLLARLGSVAQKDRGDEPVDWLRQRGLEIVHGPGGLRARKAERGRIVVPASVMTALTLPLEWEGEPSIGSPTK